MNKGQMEMFGLMMVAMIMGVLVLLAYYYIATNPSQPHDKHEELEQGVLAADFVSVLEKVYVEECRNDYGTIVKMCANGVVFPVCDTCAKIGEVANTIIEKTLNEWKVEYRYTIKVKNTDKITPIKTSNCDDNTQKEAPGTNTIPLYPQQGEAIMKLEMCKY